MEKRDGFDGSAQAATYPPRLITKPKHRRWLLDQALALFAFHYPASINPKGGFFGLASNGKPLMSLGNSDETQYLHATARMVFSFTLAQALGVKGAEKAIDHGMSFLWHRHRDNQRGGYFWGVDDAGTTEPQKQAYGHAFVLLAAAAALRAGHPDASRLLEDISEVIQTKFWEPEIGASSEEYSADWQPLSSYRGQNANMHLTESLMAASLITGDQIYLVMAESIAELIINRHARAANWCVPEHYHADWTIDRAYSGDPIFRPAGTTPGHAFEWSRLLVELYALGQKRHGWMVKAAESLFLTACQFGWDHKNGGVYYTLDWKNRPLQTVCLWWPCAEAITAAHKLQSVSTNPTFERWYRQVWNFVDQYFIDKSYGGWHPELNAERRPVSSIFVGKPDLYHAIQACLIPLGKTLQRPYDPKFL